MQIATSPINWNNEDVPEYRPWVPYPQILDEIQRAGYRLTEWAKSLSEDPYRLREDLAARGIQAVGAFVALELKRPEVRDQELAKALDRARFLQAIGASYLVVADPGDELRRRMAGRVAKELELPPEAVKAVAQGLETLALRVGEMGIRVVVHPHAGTYLETEGEVRGLLEATDPRLVGLCLDTGHLVFGGVDPLEVITDYGERIWYVHLKDVDGHVLEETRGQGFRQALLRFVFVPLGTGVARIPETVRALRDTGFRGLVVVEQDTSRHHPTEAAARNRLYLENLLREDA